MSPSLLAGALMLGRAWADPRRSLPIGRVASLSRGRTRVGRRAGPGFLCYDSSLYQSMSFRRQIKKITKGDEVVPAATCRLLTNLSAEISIPSVINR